MNPLTPIKIVALLLSAVAGGALGGYHAALFSPIPAQIAIVDVQALVKKAIEKNAAQTEDDAKALTEQVKATTDKLVQQGVVVLDAQSVLNAPEEAYVRIE